ncbi:MAG: hypothetical protein IT380_09950 [Myxococcales bacterium]|nr:hypothetical protein [Myxococcales bacterium]
MTAPWNTDDHRETLRGQIIRALLEHRDRLLAVDPWLALPQDHCCFSFGARGRPVPIGALFILWDSCAEMVGHCPECGDDGYGFAFGGALTVGGILGACIGCQTHLWRPLGGLATVGRIIAPYLRGTPFFLKDGRFGGTVGSDGRELIAQLRLLGVRLADAP